MGAAWQFAAAYPQLTAACVPISSVYLVNESYATVLRRIPIWLFQGGLDGAPDAGTAEWVTVATYAPIGQRAAQDSPASDRAVVVSLADFYAIDCDLAAFLYLSIGGLVPAIDGAPALRCPRQQ